MKHLFFHLPEQGPLTSLRKAETSPLTEKALDPKPILGE
jgi:hypothetical protein